MSHTIGRKKRDSGIVLCEPVGAERSPSPPPSAPTPVASVRSVEPPPRRRELIDNDLPLSRCRIWNLLEQYYQQATLENWDETLPCYVTSNPVIGDVYADLIVAALNDAFESLDLKAPVYIVELAAGSGMFSFHALRALKTRLASSKRLRKIDVRYVMTDFTANNVDAWERVPSFREFFESGVLDTAVFWPERDALVLRRAKTALEGPTNPVFVIANYFFDSIRADVFRSTASRLYEARYSFGIDPASAHDSCAAFRSIEAHVRYVAAKDEYYESPIRNAVLKRCVESYSELTFSFPTAAFDVIDNLRARFRAPIVLLASDKGFIVPESQRTATRLDFTEHGSISFAVNFDAIAKYIAALNGDSFRSEQSNASIHTLCGIIPAAGSTNALELDSARAQFDHRVRVGDELNALLSVQSPLTGPVPDVQTNEERQILADTCMGIVRALRHDPFAFARTIPYLDAVIAHLPLRDDAYRTLRRVEENVYLGLATSARTLTSLGRTYLLGRWPSDAIRVLELARSILGDLDGLIHMLSAAYEQEGRTSCAIACIEILMKTPAGPDMSEAIAMQRSELVGRLYALQSRSLPLAAVG